MGCGAANGHLNVVKLLVNADTPIDPEDKLGVGEPIRLHKI